MTRHPWPFNNDWSIAETDKLKQAAVEGLSNWEIAHRCGRSQAETEEKLGALINQGFLIVAGDKVVMA